MSIAYQSKSKPSASRGLAKASAGHDATCAARSETSAPGFESAGWYQHVSVAAMDFRWSNEDLLRRSATDFTGNLRYAWDGARPLLIGEVPLPKDVENPIAVAEQRMRVLLTRCAATGPAPDDEQLATLIAESGLSFERRERGWVLPTQLRIPETTISAGIGGIQVESVLVQGDPFSEVSRDALALFCCRAHRVHRFVRFVMSESDVRVISQADSNWLEIDFPASVDAVLSAAIRFRGAVTALRLPELARAYLAVYARATADPFEV
ncbi:MAG: hypothetical protein AB7V46_20065 [Thermomicrobiales bacterium]